MIGQTISHYRIVERLGGGGMGVVYKAEDTRLHRFVALKFLPDDVAKDPQTLSRFQREAQAASALNHPNICTIYDIGEEDGKAFIAMEYLEGATLKHMIEGRPLKTRTVAGAEHSDRRCPRRRPLRRNRSPRHQAGKHLRQPARAGEDPRLRSGETHAPEPRRRHFGSDETRTAISVDQLTTPGTAMGTIAYMSPEQARGEALDHRTDLFSFGVVLYEMATGHQAFSGTTSAVVFEAILNKVPIPPVQLNPGLPPQLEIILNKALEKDRELRCQSAAELRADLKRLKRDIDSSRSAASGVVSTVATEKLRPVKEWAHLKHAVVCFPCWFAWVFWPRLQSDCSRASVFGDRRPPAPRSITRSLSAAAKFAPPGSHPMAKPSSTAPPGKAIP